MFKFLLKKKYNTIKYIKSNQILLFIVSVLLPMILTYFFIAFLAGLSNFNYSSSSAQFSSFFFVVAVCSYILMNIGFFIIYLIERLIEKYRENNPFSINHINQNGKLIEERNFPSLNKREYYYNGNLHNEEHGAIQYDNGNALFYLFGKKYNPVDFKEQKDKIILQEKMEKF